MCLAAPAKILEIYEDEERALVDYGGIKKHAVLSFIENPKIGDYVIIHAGYAIEKLNEKQAIENLKAWDQFLDVVEKEKESVE
ncbi:MAG: HypC/HybG/HupF family hydrogenase formation chaperone [Candidatus Lokiarchaeota archaeon]|nr:HypC/HybG/HupF family hydrogenase formation chaperone [Candidatus Lokiarchaeota archaeon]